VDTAMSRRARVLVACLMGIAWAEMAQAESFKVQLSGAQEVPPVQTSGTGTADLTYDPSTRVVTWTIAYSGLSGTATMAHFHGPTGSKIVIWLSKKGSPAESPIKGESTLDPEHAQLFESGDLYINVHTQAHPGGELRGQVVPPKK
jgi:hypothetical protein